ncbi:uncharacterized protein LOC111262766 isoform X2 [Varroa jacobsoni]|uniref:uncharacterized protein LOC111262766 isoform X2 n=1 Tax=Varroa jacobsoni TaxID=62625 RepID=UPI000BF396A5|nr:uncharacterized protein LOC111262766 isoform X2 [Varroa jacobsoni]
MAAKRVRPEGYFIPRIYQPNVDYEERLVSPSIADIERRQGTVYLVSSLVEEREPFRGGIGQYDRLSEQISQRQLRGRMEARAQEHDRVMRSAFDAADFQREFGAQVAVEGPVKASKA